MTTTAATFSLKRKNAFKCPSTSRTGLGMANLSAGHTLHLFHNTTHVKLNNLRDHWKCAACAPRQGRRAERQGCSRCTALPAYHPRSRRRPASNDASHFGNPNISLGLVVGGRRPVSCASLVQRVKLQVKGRALMVFGATLRNACWVTRTQSSCCPRRREGWPCGCTRTGCWDCGQMQIRPSRTQCAVVTHLDARLSRAGRTK